MVAKEFQVAVRKAWDSKTCYPTLATKWSENIPETGQCAVTALIVQDRVGGKIAYNKNFDHYWNLLDSGDQIDLTRMQFGVKRRFKIDEIKSREEILLTEGARQFKTVARYRLLRIRIALSRS